MNVTRKMLASTSLILIKIKLQLTGIVVYRLAVLMFVSIEIQ